jgi:Domain of unknown function (DUF4249)
MRKLLLIVLLFSLIACEEQIAWDIDESISPRLVVEGILTNKYALNYVKLSLPQEDPNRVPTVVSNAIVVIISSDENYLLEETADEPGLYKTKPALVGVIGSGYRLYIKIGPYEFLSDIVWITPVSPMKEFRYNEIASFPGHFVINPKDEDEPSYTRYDISYLNPEIVGDTLHSLFYTFSLNTLDVNQFFKPKAEILVFPKKTMIIRTKYSLAPDHARYIRGLLSETQWSGGWFDVMPGNLHTNMSQGAVGYFGACSVLRDTVYFN